MKETKGKNIPMEQILNMTKELNPDDFESGSEMDLQAMIEQRDDYNPDDQLFPNPKVTRLGGGEDER